MWRIVCQQRAAADMNCWSLDNPSEHFYSSKTRQIHATPFQPEIVCGATCRTSPITNHHDTIAYGWDEDGAGVHDVISRCDPYTNYLMTGGGESHVLPFQPDTSGSAGWLEGNGRARRVECFHVHWIY
jgi:uncharacterized protein YcgI (DUF1989 family)